MDGNGRHKDEAGILDLYELEESSEQERQAALDHLASVVVPDEPDDEWFTAADLAAHKRITRRKAEYLLKKAVDDGTIEPRKFGRFNYFRVKR